MQCIDHEQDNDIYLIALNGLGNIYAINGEAQNEYLQRSIDCYQEVLNACIESKFVKTRVQALLNLGASFIALPAGNHENNLCKAQNYLEEAISLCDSADYPNAKEDQGKAFSNLAGIFLDLKNGNRTSNLNRALFYGRSALKAIGSDSSSRNGAQIRSNLGPILTELALLEKNPEYLVEANQYLQEAIKTQVDLGGIGSRIKTFTNLSGVYRAQLLMHFGDPKENLENAINFLVEALNQINPDVYVIELATTARNLGDLYFEWSNLLPNIWEKASAAYMLAIDAREKVYKTEGVLGARQIELKEIASLTRKGAYCLAKANQLDKAVEILELGRARALASALSLDAAVLEKVSENDRANFESIRNKILRLEKEERQRSERVKDSINRSEIDLSSDLRSTRKQLELIITKIQNYLPNFLPEMRSFSDIANSIGNDKFLSYIAYTPYGGFAIIVPSQSTHLDKNSVIWLDNLSTGTVESLLGVDKLSLNGGSYGFISAQAGETPGGYNYVMIMQEALDEILPLLGKNLNPFIERLKTLGCKRCSIVATGLLSLMPLHAARMDNDYFVDNGIEISFTPSAFASQVAQKALDTIYSQTLFAISDPLHESGSSLIYSRIEISEIASFFSENNRCILDQGEASQKAVYDNISDSTYVHFSCHGQFNLGNPLLSSLLLSNNDELTLSDILNRLTLSGTRLVVLSACQTAIPDFSKVPDEMIGFPTVFLQIGVPGVLGSLWPVNVLSTALLMIKFYEYHLHGNSENDEKPMSPSRALRLAQLWLRDATNSELSELFVKYKLSATDQPIKTRLAYEKASEKFRSDTDKYPTKHPYAHPYYWAPFVFYGE